MASLNVDFFSQKYSQTIYSNKKFPIKRFLRAISSNTFLFWRLVYSKVQCKVMEHDIQIFNEHIIYKQDVTYIGLLEVITSCIYFYSVVITQPFWPNPPAINPDEWTTDLCTINRFDISVFVWMQ